MDPGGDRGGRAHVAGRLTLLIVVALAVRLGVAWWVDRQAGGQFVFGDSESYWTLARTIAEGRPYEFGSPDAKVFRTPGYPLLLAPLFLAGGEPSPMLGRAVSAGFGTLAVLGVWWLGRRLFGPRAGWIAGIVAAVDPLAIATSALVLSDAAFGPLMIAELGLWMAAWDAAPRGRSGMLALAAGMIGGAAVLVRPSWLLFTPFALLAGLALGPQRRRHLGIGVAMLVGLSAAMAPWWIRNARATGHFVATTLQVGASLYDGLNPAATGASDMDFMPGFTRVQHERFRAGDGAGEGFEHYLDRQFRAAAVAWACQHPGEVLRLAGVKLARLWNAWPNEPRFSAWPVRLAMLATYVPVLVLGLVGVARSIRWGWVCVLCWLPAAYFTLLHMIFVSSIRYRQPAMLTLMVLAAGVVVGGRRGERGTE
jgi:4-amino-4-deoxy-L-arabinose transferase-like glycosyltransferase